MSVRLYVMEVSNSWVTELQNRVTENDVTLWVSNSKIFT